MQPSFLTYSVQRTQETSSGLYLNVLISIPLVYLVLMLTVFQPWYRVHTALADGIFLVMLGCVMLSWIISLIRFARRALA